MSEIITVKQGDTRHAIETPLLRNGVAVDLTDCTVKFKMNKGIDSFVTVTDATNGEVIYPLEANAVDTPGLYKAEFEVTHNDGRVETFPNESYILINIQKTIGE